MSKLTAVHESPAALSPEAEVSPRHGTRAAIRRARHLLQHGGVRGLAGGAFGYFRSLRRLVYVSQHFYVYETPLGEGAPLDFPAPAEGCELHFIEGHAQADALAAMGYDDLRLRVPGARRSLARGNVAACAYIERAFSSVDWIALSPVSLSGVARVAHKDAFRDGHACTTGAFTVPKFRNAGIGSYRLGGVLRYLRDRGYPVCDNVIPIHNAPSRRCIERFGGRVVRVGHYRSLFGLVRWTDHPVSVPVPPINPR
jgi:GNAT superfamily N-acetyltransferase